MLGFVCCRFWDFEFCDGIVLDFFCSLFLLCIFLEYGVYFFSYVYVNGLDYGVLFWIVDGIFGDWMRVLKVDMVDYCNYWNENVYEVWVIDVNWFEWGDCYLFEEWYWNGDNVRDIIWVIWIRCDVVEL